MKQILGALLEAEQPRTGQNGDIAQSVLDTAARVFRVTPQDISLQSTPDNIEGWDSFTQLNLILSLENHFDCQIPASMVSQIRSLGDAVKAVEATGR